MFNEKAKLSTLAGEVDDFGRITRGLIQAMYDHGGDTPDLNVLLRQELQPAHLFAQMAQLVVPLWALKGKNVHLGLIDFDQPSEHFWPRYPTAAVHSGVRDGEKVRFSDIKPQMECQYELDHLTTWLKRPNLLFDEVLHAYGQIRRMRHAGWRELLVYAHQQVAPEVLGNRKIIAAGSRIMTERPMREAYVPYEATTFPALMMLEGKMTIAWMGPEHDSDRATFRFGPECFYLARVYP
jgi:hypothetical protein